MYSVFVEIVVFGVALYLNRGLPGSAVYDLSTVRQLLPDWKAINDPIQRERWQTDGDPRAPQTGGAS